MAGLDLTAGEQRFDYIIVGGGSAGCVLANRLSEDADTRVLLLEAGGSDHHVFLQMPAALSIPMNMKRFNWFYESEPEPGMDGRRLHCPRGKVIGGSSSINGMAYVRGNPGDFDGWQAMGCAGWSYADCLPYFRKAENFSAGGDAYRGAGGPLGTSRGTLRNPLYRAFIAAGVQAGYGATDDMNGHRQEGFGPMDMTVQGGRRASTARCYLEPVRQRKNLHVQLGVQVESIAFEGNRASGVTIRLGGTTYSLQATRELILCAGPIGDPQLLMLSGIGPGEHLQEQGIETRVHLPGVGGNLMDHLEIYVQMRCRQPVSLYSAMNPISKGLLGARWLLTHAGVGASNQFESGGFIRSRAGVPYPDIQYHFLPLAISYDGRTMPKSHGFQVHAGHNLPQSRGSVRLRNCDPNSKPLIRFNYLSEEADRAGFRACVRLTREIFAQPAFDPYSDDELAPGADVQSDADIDAFVRAKAESAYHPSGTCTMGMGSDAVVDPSGKVHGIEGLRVVDSAIMPMIPNGNLNAPTIMLAEKLADAIRGRPPLPPAHDVPVWQPRDWRRRQREGVPVRSPAVAA